MLSSEAATCSWTPYFHDAYAVLNPRYLLPAATPMAACLAIALAESRLAATARWILQGLLALATVAVGLLVIWERFGV